MAHGGGRRPLDHLLRQPPDGAGWRSTLATGVATAALLAYGARPVRAQTSPPTSPCNEISGTLGEIVTCTGNLSSGVLLTNGGGIYSVLNVNNLTTNIAPAAGVSGIVFTSNGAVDLNIHPQPFAIVTTDADGIFAASNGGSVTINSTADIATSGGSAVGLASSAQNAATVITSSGNITTYGNNAFGIAAGANDGSVTVTSTGNIATAGTFAAGINVGTIGTSGTTDGAITITSTGNIATAGASAIGINASSVYGPIDITSSGNVAALGDNSIGINAQTNGDITITSTGDVVTGVSSSTAIKANSQGGSVDIAASGDIATFGNYARGIEVTGVGPVSITSSGDITTAGVYAAAIEVSGGSTTTITSTGNIAALGMYSVGIFVSSTTGASVTSTGNIATFGALGTGIEATSSGATSVANTGNITTTDGVGIFARGSSTGAVTITSTGDVTATNNTALYARSLGTGPVSVASNGTITAGLTAIRARGNGAVTVDSTGDITSSTEDAIRVMSASSATVILRSGTVYGAVDGVEFVGGASTGTLRNYASLSGGTYAVSAGGGNDTVHNYGTITGNIRGVDTFNNRAGGLFNAGDAVEVGTLNNAGTFAPGGIGAIEATVLDDDVVQTGSGILAVDIGGNTSDQVMVSDMAVLAGTVAVNVISLPAASAQQFTILQALGGVTNNGLALSASPALHASLAFTATTVLLTTSINFTISGLSPNERAISDNLNSALAAGGGSLDPLLLALLNTTSLEAYENALDQLSPEIVSDAQIAALYATLGFSSSLLSCRVNGTDTASIVREGQCLWAGASARFLDSGSTFNQIGFTETAGLFAAGVQVALDDVWRLGVGAAYQSSWLKSATNATSEGDQAQAGIAVKYNPGPLLLAGVVNGGRGWYDTMRPIAFGGFAATAQSDSAIDILNGGVRAAYVFGSPELYFKPMLDADVTRLALGGFTETGGGAANLVVQGQQQTVYTLAPTIEVGTEWWLANGTLVRPFLRTGAVWYEGGDFALNAGFLGAPAGVAPFTILTDMDDVMGVVGAGLDVINAGDAALRLSYDGQLGETTQIHSVALKGSARF